MPYTLLDISAVLLIHAQESRHRGTDPTIRDLALLESALGRVENHIAYAESVDVFTVAASLAFGIARNHPFIDGNKRTSFASAMTFLYLNRYELSLETQDEAIALWQELAAGRVSEPHLASWLADHSSPRV